MKVGSELEVISYGDGVNKCDPDKPIPATLPFVMFIVKQPRGWGFYARYGIAADNSLRYAGALSGDKSVLRQIDGMNIEDLAARVK